MPATVKQNNNPQKFYNADAIIRLYSEWADTYDNELRDWAYVAPEKGVNIFKKYILNKGVSILDIGCGTGLVGTLLHDAGYDKIDGMDICSTMLSKAHLTDAYNLLLLRDLMSKLTLPQTSYDAIISVGTFTQSHVGPAGIDHVLHMLRKDGLACITINADSYTEEGYQAKLEQLVDKGDCTIIEESQEPYIIGQNIHSRIVVLRKT